jgi:hypothetical protein
VTEEELPNEEDLPEQGEDAPGIGRNDAIDRITALVTVTCYLIRVERADVRDHGDATDLGHNDPRADMGTTYLCYLSQDGIEVSVTINLTEPVHSAAEHARAACGGCEELKKAAADYAGNRAVNAIWPTDQWPPADGLSINEAAEALNQTSDWLRSLVECPIDGLAISAGVPDPVAVAGAGVVGTFVMASITRPVEDAAKIIEVVGIVVGLVTGLHPLVLACARPLAHSEIAGLVAKALEKAMSPMEAHSDASPTDAPSDPAATSCDETTVRQIEYPTGSQDKPSKDRPTPRETLLRVDAEDQDPVSEEGAVDDAARIHGDAVDNPFG